MSGRVRSARRHSDEARRTGTKDPLLLYRAGVIADATGEISRETWTGTLTIGAIALAGAPWWRYAVASLGTATVMTLPFFLMDPGAFVRQQFLALTFHEEVWGANLLHAMQFSGADVEGLLPLFFLLELVLTLGAVALAARSRLDTLGRTAIAACLVVTVPLLLARWTTQSYYVYAVTLALLGLAVLGVTAPGYQGGTRSRDYPQKVERGSISPGSTTA